MALKDRQNSILSSIPYLGRRALYKREKPYGADFPVDDIQGAKMTNHVFDTLPVEIHDARALEEPLDLERNGACFIKAKTSLHAEEASNEMNAPAMQTYSREIVQILLERFPQYSDIRFMDMQVRKRSPQFPDGHGQKAEFSQPAAVPHTDFSVKGAFMWLQDELPEEEGLYEGRNFDLINVWRVLKGPNNDWPLAICDYTTVDTEKDASANDALHITRIGENWLLHHNDKHKWYYLSGMEKDDLIVFRNTDSEGKLSRCFHAAFNNPNSKSGLRESVEVRVVAFR